MVDVMRTGLTALMASQRALATTSHNIANANTPGYSRQRTSVSSNIPFFAGSAGRPMYVGTGVSVQSITRAYDDFLTQQVRGHSSNVAQSETMDQWISQLDGALGTGDTGLAPALDQFFAAAQDVANSPASLPARQALLGQANTVSARFQELDNQMNALRQGSNQSLSNAVGDINSLAEGIAKINQTIVLAQGGTGGTAPDLLDQRDQMVADLARKAPVSTLEQSDGTLTVFVGNGQTLVQGYKTNALETAPASSDPRKLDIRFKQTSAIVTDFLNGGEIGGLVAFQKQVLDPAQNKLGLMAAGLAETVNDQHRLGMDLNNQLGTDFFKVGGPKIANNTNNSDYTTYNADGNALSVAITDIGQAQPSDYELSYVGGSYSLRRLSDDKTVASGSSPLNVDGLSITVNTAPAAGSRFFIQPTGTAARDFKATLQDPRQIAAAAPIKTSAAQSNSGTGKISAGAALDASDPNLLSATSIQFTSPTQYTVNGGAPISYTSGADIDVNGWRVQITGAPAVGDTFQVGSNAGGVGDNRNALKLGGLQTQKTLLNGSDSVQDLHGQMTAEVGLRGSTTQSTLKAQTALLEQANQARDGVSGVNLDEEAANLMKYQQSYEAAARVIQIGDSVIQSLLDAIRR
ncbi:MAG: flagellar hook-associated protein FlgK [Candidatus Competibacteraceae bacterium]|nr:flagellar hook-associated protein FlgK [Candidatus Competibacteraceae bacterium]